MNAKQKIHQIQLLQWSDRFKEQAASGLSARAWCAGNGFSIHTYNYWKHLLKQEYADSVLPDIVPLDMSPILQPVSPFLPTTPGSASASNDSRDSLDTIRISVSGIRRFPQTGFFTPFVLSCIHTWKGLFA